MINRRRATFENIQNIFLLKVRNKVMNQKRLKHAWLGTTIKKNGPRFIAVIGSISSLYFIKNPNIQIDTNNTKWLPRTIPLRGEKQGKSGIKVTVRSYLGPNIRLIAAPCGKIWTCSY